MKLYDFLRDRDLDIEFNEKRKVYVLIEEGEVRPSNQALTKALCKEVLRDYYVQENMAKEASEIDKKDCLSIVKKCLSEPDRLERKKQEEERKEEERKEKERHEEYERKRKEMAGEMHVGLPDPMDFCIYREKHGKGEDFLYDMRNKRISTLDIENFIKAKMDKLNAERAPGEKKVGRPSWGDAGLYTAFYDPKPGVPPHEKKVDENGVEWMHFNLYEAPEWVKAYEEERENAYVPPLIEKYLNTLFLGNEATIERIYDWFANCLFYRDPIMLCLVSPGEGVGKTLCVNLVGGLHSPGRYFKPPTDVLTGVFNHSLFAKSLILFDEINAVGAAKENLRKLIGNDEVVTRRMNHDQGSKLDQPMSYACTTNVPRHVGIEGRGRRFFIPNITHEKLDKSLSTAEITELGLYTKAFNTTTPVDERIKVEMARFGWFLYNRYEAGVECSQAELENIKPKNFWDCQYACMNKWQQGVMDYLLSRRNMPNEVLSLSQMRGKLTEVEERYLPNYSELAAFLTNHDWRGTRLATIEEYKVFKNSQVTPIIHKDYEYELTPYDNQIQKEEERDLV